MSEDAKVKRPASQYYWGDWFKDVALQSCSLPARGLWHEMNCLQHQGEPYGHLTLPNGKPMTPVQLANICKIPQSMCKRLLDELEGAGVFSRDPDTGAIFSRRMVRDEVVRNARANGGKAGAEHGIKGAEHGVKGGRPSAAEGGSETPLGSSSKPPPSSSSSSSSSSSPSGSSPNSPSAGDSPPPAGDGPPPLLGDDSEPQGIPACDHNAVLALWREHMAVCPQPVKWTDTRRRHLQARWRELFAEGKAHNRDEALAWFARFFRYLAKSHFLTGRVKPRDPGRPAFLAELPWVLEPENFVQCIEGKYHPEA